MEKISSNLDNFSEFTGKICSWFVAIMVVVTCIVVIMRYGLDMGSVMLQDVVLYLHGGLFLLGAAFALKRGAHVRVDIFYRNFSDSKKALVDLVGNLIFFNQFAGSSSFIHGAMLNSPGELWRFLQNPTDFPSYIFKNLY